MDQQLAVRRGNNSANAPRRLFVERQKLLKEGIGPLNALRMHGHFSRFEPPIGGNASRKRRQYLFEGLDFS